MSHTIRMVLLEATVEDAIKLKQGGFFDGYHVLVPEGASGTEALLRVPDKNGDERKPTVLAESSLQHECEVTPAELAEIAESAESVNGFDRSADPARDMAAVEEALKVGPSPLAVVVAPSKEEAKTGVTKELPKGNGKKYSAAHARIYGCYVVGDTEAVYKGRNKAGYAFQPDYGATVTLTESDIIEELDVGGADVVVPDDAAQDTDDVQITTEKLVTFTKLRDLVQYITDAGIPVEGVREFCESMKEQVPLLSRIGDIPGRVERTLLVMGLVAEP
jgi:hypothetical protein